MRARALRVRSRSFFGISVSSRRRPPHARPRQTPEHAISYGELQARSPRRLLLKRPYADVGGAGSDRLALQPLPKHPAVKRSPEVTDLRPGAGRPGGAGPGHGYGVRGGFRAVAGNYSPGEQVNYYLRAYS